MTGWIIAVCALLLLGLLLWLPIRMHIAYEEEPRVRVRYAFITVHFPQKRVKPKKEAEKKAKETSSKPNVLCSNLKEHGLSGFLQYICQIVAILARFIKRTGRRVKMEECSVSIAVHEADAAATAVRYGQVCAVVYPAVSALCNITECHKAQVSIKPDYIMSPGGVHCRLAFHIRAGALLAGTLRALWEFIAFSVRMEKEKQTEKTERKDLYGAACSRGNDG